MYADIPNEYGSPYKWCNSADVERAAAIDAMDGRLATMEEYADWIEGALLARRQMLYFDLRKGDLDGRLNPGRQEVLVARRSFSMPENEVYLGAPVAIIPVGVDVSVTKIPSWAKFFFMDGFLASDTGFRIYEETEEILKSRGIQIKDLQEYMKSMRDIVDPFDNFKRQILLREAVALPHQPQKVDFLKLPALKYRR